MHYLSLTASERIDTWVPVFFFAMVWIVMQWYRKLPSTDSIQQFVSVINSRGGNIAILAVASVYFFRYSMYLFMNLLSMVKDKTISEDNAFGLMAIQFVTTSAFGGAMGALLKTMTGENTKARASDTPDGNGSAFKVTPGTPVITPLNSAVSASLDLTAQRAEHNEPVIHDTPVKDATTPQTTPTP